MIFSKRSMIKWFHPLIGIDLNQPLNYTKSIGRQWLFKEDDLIYYFEWTVVKSKSGHCTGQNHGYFGTVHAFQAKLFLDYEEDEIEITEQTYLCTGLEQNEYIMKKDDSRGIVGA